MSRLRLCLVSLAAFLSLPALSGDYMGNGGGLGEQNAAYVWSQYRTMTAMILAEHRDEAEALKKLDRVRASYAETAFEVLPQARLSAEDLHSTERFSGYLFTTASRVVWVQERLLGVDNEPMSLNTGAYWLTQALAERSDLDREKAQWLGMIFLENFGTQVRVKGLTRYNRPDVRLITMLGRLAHLQSSLHLSTLPIPEKICESQGLKQNGPFDLSLQDLAWMGEDSWDRVTGEIYLGARSDFEIRCWETSGNSVLLVGEIVWELPFTLRDRKSGAKLPYADAVSKLSDPDYELRPSSVSWNGVRNLRRR